MPINIDTMRKGFIQDSSGNNLLPITHISLIIGDDGTSINNTFNALKAEHAELKGEHATILTNHEELKGDHAALRNEHDALRNEHAEMVKEIDLIDGKLTSVKTFALLNSINTQDLIEGAIAYVVEENKYYSYTSNGWVLMTTGSNGESLDGYSHIWVGPTPPENVNMIWIDTSSDGIPDNEDDYKTLLDLLEQVAEMQIEIINLKDRIEYLEKNGVVIDPDNPPDSPPDDPDDPIYDIDDIILLEDGSEMLLEDGTGLLLEIQVVDGPIEDEDSEDTILLEDGSELLLEDGFAMMLEIQTESVKPPTTQGNVLLFENSTEMLLENGNNLLLER